MMVEILAWLIVCGGWLFALILLIMWAYQREQKKKAWEEGKKWGLWEFVELLRTKDKVYLNKVNMKGDNQTMKNCVFFGHPDNESCLHIYTPRKKGK